MRRETSVVAGVVAAAAAVVGMFLLMPVVARARPEAGPENSHIALMPRNARARRLALRLEKKAKKHLVHARYA